MCSLALIQNKGTRFVGEMEMVQCEEKCHVCPDMKQYIEYLYCSISLL